MVFLIDEMLNPFDLHHQEYQKEDLGIFRGLLSLPKRDIFIAF